MGIFDTDGLLMRFLNRLADLLVLNLLVLLCSIPVVTIGPALTAMHYVLLKMIRGEEGYVRQQFFHSFRQNFRQGVILGLLCLLLLAVGLTDWILLRHMKAAGEMHNPIPAYLLAAAGIFCYMVALYIFPLLSRFENSVGKIIINSALLAVGAFPKTVLMVLISALPLLILRFAVPLYPVVFLFGISGPGYFCARLYSPLFRKFEPEEEISEC